MPAYAKTSLIKKLGIKEGMCISILNEPEHYRNLIGPLPETISHKPLNQSDVIQLFTRSQETLREQFPQLKSKLKKSGMLWVCWPKSSCSFASSDLQENIIRSIGLENGLVDTKIISIDNNWSGLKFVYRLKDR